MERTTGILIADEGRTGEGVRVVVIDSGVHAQHPHVRQVSGGVAIDAAGKVTTDFVDRLGHGTAVTAVIREKAPDADIHVVKVFDRELATTGTALCAAIRLAAEGGAALVNLSLGTTNQAHETALSAAVRDATAAGVLIVAAGEQPDARWLPGALAGVIAVDLDWTLPREIAGFVVGSDGIRLRASGFPRPIPGVPPERNLKGLSFAVANATGLLACMLQGSDAKDAALAFLSRELRRRAVRSDPDRSR